MDSGGRGSGGKSASASLIAACEQAAYAEPSTRTAYMRSHSNDQFQDEPRSAYYESPDRYVTRPVSAYAPMDPQIPIEILSGRGLY